MFIAVDPTVGNAVSDHGAANHERPMNDLLDDEVLAQAGITGLSGYAVDPSRPLLPDLFLD